MSFFCQDNRDVIRNIFQFLPIRDAVRFFMSSKGIQHMIHDLLVIDRHGCDKYIYIKDQGHFKIQLSKTQDSHLVIEYEGDEMKRGFKYSYDDKSKRMYQFMHRAIIKTKWIRGDRSKEWNLYSEISTGIVPPEIFPFGGMNPNKHKKKWDENGRLIKEDNFHNNLRHGICFELVNEKPIIRQYKNGELLCEQTPKQFAEFLMQIK